MANHQDTMTPYGTSRKTYQSYVIGLVLSIIFTLTAFTLVGYHLLPNQYLYISLAVLALMQLIAQVICFLRLTANAEGRWNTMPFLFTIVIVAVLAGGSLWIMYNLNYNMIH